MDIGVPIRRKEIEPANFQKFCKQGSKIAGQQAHGKDGCNLQREELVIKCNLVPSTKAKPQAGKLKEYRQLKSRKAGNNLQEWLGLWNKKVGKRESEQAKSTDPYN